MAAVALIRYTQGVTVGLPGVALVGVPGVAVQVENDSPTDVQSWKIDLLYSPPGSSVSPGVLATGNSNTALANFIPDAVPGTYRIMLTVYSGLNQTGQSNKDIRCFAIRDSQGFIYPPYQQLPPKLPVLGSGVVGEKPDELNFNSQSYGWDGDGTDGLMLSFMREVSSTLDLLGGGGIGVVRTLTANRTETIPAGREALHMQSAFLDNGTLDLEGEFTGIDFPENHSLTRVPHRSYKRIRANEAMFYQDLVVEGHLDVDGDLIPLSTDVPEALTGQDILDLLTSIAPDTPAILGVASPTSFLTPAQARTVMSVLSEDEVLGYFDTFQAYLDVVLAPLLPLPEFNLYWGNSNSDGSYSGSDIIFTTNFAGERGRINRWNGSVAGLVATLPTGLSALQNVRCSFFEATSNGEYPLTINVLGTSRIRSKQLPAAGVTQIEVQGKNSFVVLLYDSGLDMWEIIQGEEYIRGAEIENVATSLAGVPVTLYLYYTLQNNSIIQLNYTVQAADATGQAALYNVRALYSRDGSGVVTERAFVKTVDHEDVAGWDVQSIIGGPVIQIRGLSDTDATFRIVGRVLVSSWA